MYCMQIRVVFDNAIIRQIRDLPTYGSDGPRWYEIVWNNK